MRVHAFHGVLYGPAAGADPGRLAAQPYDQINDTLAAELHASDPHHFTWLSKPAPGAAADLYQEAARLHDAWLAAGALQRDPVPALYPYEIELAGGGRRLGVMVLVGLELPSTGVIRPHEETLAKPLADRLALLEAMQVDLEPALILSEDRGELDRLLGEDIAGQEAIVVHTDEFGHRHLLYRVTNPARISRYQQTFAGRPAAIADGHHRYKVGLRYAEARGLLGRAEAAAAKLAVVTSLDSPALAIEPIHRALKSAEGLDAAAALTTSRTLSQATNGTDFAAEVAAAPQPALGVVTAAGAEVWHLSPAQGTAAHRLSPGAQKLAVALLHGQLLPAMGYAEAAATDGTVIYRSDPEVLGGMVPVDAAVALFLPPMAPPEFAVAIEHGDLLPPKSTRFLPKVMSGLVWAEHGSGVL